MENPMSYTPNALSAIVHKPGMTARDKALAAVIELEAQGLFPKGLDTTLATNELEAVIEEYEKCLASGMAGASLEAQLVNKLGALSQ